MKITVEAKPASREAYVKKLDDASFEVAVKEPPVEGRANAAIIKAVADYFGISHFRVKIISGQTSRRKVIEILI